MSSILTNKHNLPETLYQAVAYDTHKTIDGGISVTQFVDAPQIRILKQKHTIHEDVSDRIWMLLGTAVHHVLERSNPQLMREGAYEMTQETIELASMVPPKTEEDEKFRATLGKVASYLKEVKKDIIPENDSDLEMERTVSIDLPNGIKLYGTYDMRKKSIKRLIDYKLCSVYNYIFPEERRKWEAQLNTYAWILWNEHQIEIESLMIVAIFRDWSKSSAHKNDYPPRQVMEIELTKYGNDQMTKYIHGRADLHKRAQEGEYIPCTPKERWAKADQFSVYKSKESTARSLFNTDQLQAAEKFLIDNRHKHNGDMIIMQQFGNSRRCEHYCSVNEVCPQYKEMKARPEKIAISESLVVEKYFKE